MSQELKHSIKYIQRRYPEKWKKYEAFVQNKQYFEAMFKAVHKSSATMAEAFAQSLDNYIERSNNKSNLPFPGTTDAGLNLKAFQDQEMLNQIKLLNEQTKQTNLLLTALITGPSGKVNKQ